MAPITPAPCVRSTKPACGWIWWRAGAWAPWRRCLRPSTARRGCGSPRACGGAPRCEACIPGGPRCAASWRAWPWLRRPARAAAGAGDGRRGVSGRGAARRGGQRHRRVAGAAVGSVRLLAFAPDGLPTRVPQVVAAVLAVVVLAVLVAALRARASAPARRNVNGGVWWAVLGAPLSATPAIDYFITGLWDLLRGGARVTQPTPCGLEPALRGAAGGQSRSAWLSRAADRRARPGRAAGPGVCVAGRRLAAPVLPAAADDRARPAFSRGGGPGRRLARPRARRRGRRAHRARRDRCAADRVCGRELLARGNASAHRSAGLAGPRPGRSRQRRRRGR